MLELLVFAAKACQVGYTNSTFVSLCATELEFPPSASLPQVTTLPLWVTAAKAPTVEELESPPILGSPQVTTEPSAALSAAKASRVA